MFAFEVQHLRRGPYRNLLAFFDVVLGDRTAGAFIGVVTVKGVKLMAKKAGGCWLQFPATRRLENGMPVKDQNGFDRYDPHVDLARGDRAWPTIEAREFAHQLLADVTERYGSQGAAA